MEIDVHDGASLGRWLEDHRGPLAEVVALRASLRLVPFIAYIKSSEMSGDQEKRFKSLATLACFRMQSIVAAHLLFNTRQFQRVIDETTELLEKSAKGTSKLFSRLIIHSGSRDLVVGLVGLAAQNNVFLRNMFSGFESFSPEDWIKLSLQGGLKYFEKYEGGSLPLQSSYIGSPILIDTGAVDTGGVRSCSSRRLWHGAQMPTVVEEAWDDLCSTIGFHSEHWDYWRRWYQGHLDGTPVDLELQKRVATINYDIWTGDDAPRRVAEEIARIEREWEAEKAKTADRAPDFEPGQVSLLFEYPKSVSASVTVAATSIVQSFEVFRRESGLNETPEFLLPLEAIPASLDRIGNILAQQAQSVQSEQALREEIGRLNAKVADLERELSKAKTDAELKRKPWFGKVALFGTGVAGLVSAVWTVSGDDLGPRQRCEMLSEYWEFFGGLPLGCEGPGRPMQADVPELPETHDI